MHINSLNLLIQKYSYATELATNSNEYARIGVKRHAEMANQKSYRQPTVHSKFYTVYKTNTKHSNSIPIIGDISQKQHSFENNRITQFAGAFAFAWFNSCRQRNGHLTDHSGTEVSLWPTKFHVIVAFPSTANIAYHG